ncbi:hypothetical protein SPRG_20332 [Saprolegnia parasitica CBS 223.65]|uniref:Aspartyl/asparaginy/proline hydroxylase domain-containing protein n=1 Tax=Saprolegnia parasitica (strain CBS 223.65) TaxID=695850 RepID=A0A067CLP6_SAPPC|nr:hypothetical protein SPRG_20332 [Saprolegnia parasitica CBS 223.65]KDO27481.1 hypothetical protein SPRG_20332 [Saprolegnia parasitica CBS 223.65]|eukprot:XP_012201945.1 hypothetical protein SPRG_20332 [Saprolegnia parasitica CBS 223.65]
MAARTGEIPLSEKVAPTVALAKRSHLGDLVSLRATNVDVRPFQERLQRMEETMAIWNPEQQVNNVPMHHAHLCDDYLKHLYHFPWLDQWRDLLFPFFESLNIPPERVIRCLFARMPAGSVIPVHHDTGAWVAHCHRVHLPIITSDHIDFKVGLDEDAMQRIEFAQGNVYELNNASKHMVENKWNQARVHLIFDYVDADFSLASLPLRKLAPGTVLHQTRRTVDMSSEFGSRPTPSFCIIGAQKAGTTSLYDYITQHDLVVPANRKETHYLDWRFDPKLPPIETPEGQAAHLAMYQRFFRMDILGPCPSVLSGEATPSYLLGGSVVIQRFQALMPGAKILATLRNPVDRAFSHYNMTADPVGNPEQLKNRGHHALGGKSFEQVVDAEIAELQALGVHPDMSFEEFDRVYLQTRLSFTHGGHSFIGRGLYALQLKGWFEAFPKDQLHIVNMDDMKTSTGLHAVMQDVFAFLELPPYTIEDSSAKNTRAYGALHPDTRARLQAFYAPFNEALADLLGRRSFAW